jgi:hypothetical protein
LTFTRDVLIPDWALNLSMAGSFAGGKTALARSGLVDVLSGCALDPFSGGAAGGVVCGTYNFRRVAVNSTLPRPLNHGLMVSQLEFPTNVSLVPWNSKRLSHPHGFAFVAAANHVSVAVPSVVSGISHFDPCFTLGNPTGKPPQTYRLNFQRDLTAFAFDVSGLTGSEWLILRVVYQEVREGAFVLSDCSGLLCA